MCIRDSYKLLQEIGRGGFGVVWMAEQEGPIRRRVALKIIKAGMDTKEVIARFEAERQALALMDHTNICLLYTSETNGFDRCQPFRVRSIKPEAGSRVPIAKASLGGPHIGSCLGGIDAGWRGQALDGNVRVLEFVQVCQNCLPRIEGLGPSCPVCQFGQSLLDFLVQPNGEHGVTLYGYTRIARLIQARLKVAARLPGSPGIPAAYPTTEARGKSLPACDIYRRNR